MPSNWTDCNLDCVLYRNELCMKKQIYLNKGGVLFIGRSDAVIINEYWEVHKIDGITGINLCTWKLMRSAATL